MRIHHIALSVRNLDRSVEFYKEVFGFVEVKRFEREDLGGKAVFIKLKEMQIEIWEFKNQILNNDDYSDLNILGIKHIAFQVENIDEMCEKLKSKKY